MPARAAYTGTTFPSSPTSMRRLLELSLLGVACCALPPALAQVQDDGWVQVAPVENVKFDYAQVLRAEPVYQTLRATRAEQRIDFRQLARQRIDRRAVFWRDDFLLAEEMLRGNEHRAGNHGLQLHGHEGTGRQLHH